MVVALGALIAPTAGTAAPRHTPKADLKLARFNPLLGNPAYAVVDTAGVVEPIDVQVKLINESDVKARASTTIVRLDDSGNRHFVHVIRVPALKPHQPFRATLVFRGARPALGFAEIVGEVDNGGEITDKVKRRVAIVAKQWNVSEFQTVVTFGQNTSTTVNGSGFRFVLSRYNHARRVFHYDAFGPVFNLQSLTGVCNYTGSDKQTRTPWAGGDDGLEIAADLEGYQAVIQASTLPKYQITGTCLGGIRTTAMVGYNDLLTFVGLHVDEAAMSATDTKLQRTTMNAATHSTFKWKFEAAIP